MRKLLIAIGFPLRFILFVMMRVVMAIVMPYDRDFPLDWGWVVTGVDKDDRKKQRRATPSDIVTSGRHYHD